MKKTEIARSRAFVASDYKRVCENNKSQSDFSVGLINDDLFTWEVILIGPKDTELEGGLYRAEMCFTDKYPEEPPKFRFLTKMWHPNIDEEGFVCISILHPPGNDVYGYEEFNERWLPVRTPESIILSILSLLSEPNPESPANLEAAHHFLHNKQEYLKKVRKLAEKSLEE